MTPDLYGAHVRKVRTLRTGHSVPGPWQRVRRVWKHHVVLEDGTSWPLAGMVEGGIYPPGGPVHLEIEASQEELL